MAKQELLDSYFGKLTAGRPNVIVEFGRPAVNFPKQLSNNGENTIIQLKTLAHLNVRQ